ncbi:PPA1309 family protein [Kutzneria viridogrisea]|uniref:PPA1309 family protein n=1 Tax=Kutzneria viridogrisea TaxID=47990 RepID=UPI00338B1604
MCGVPADNDDNAVDAAQSPLPSIAREVEDFVSTGGWDQPPQMFALVRTAELLAQQPELADQLDVSAELTPVAQDPLPEQDLGEALSGIEWPEVVAGCALAQEIVVLPPGAEQELDSVPQETEVLRRVAAEHPQRREARLVAAVLRNGSIACVLRLRGDQERPDEIVEHPELAPNLTDALMQTLRP